VPCVLLQIQRVLRLTALLLFCMLACLLLQSDERVQLQRLRDQLLSSDGQPGRVQSQVLRAPLLLGLTDAESQLLEAYADRVAAWGWRWQPSSARSDCGSPETLLTHAPLLWGIALTTTDLTVGPARLNIACYSACAARIMSFWAKPFDRVCRALPCLLSPPQLYLHQLHDTFGSGALPPAVVRVLNSKACRGAIMFGDRLQHTQVRSGALHSLLVDWGVQMSPSCQLAGVTLPDLLACSVKSCWLTWHRRSYASAVRTAGRPRHHL
jgi:DNA mismatch repair ATPase MutL